MKTPHAPLPLSRGDTMGIIAPAGQLTDTTRFTRGVAILRDMGFSVVSPRNLWPGQEYLAGSDENRAAEFNRLYCDPEVGALICLRGGYGCLRMIERIDLALVASQAKMIIGFSDITVLANYLFEKTDLISLHGPVVTSLADVSPAALERFFLSLTGRWDEPLAVKELEILRDGPTVTAPLVGGNLASLVSLLGTPYDFSWDGKIVFLEDINEAAYRVDRMVTQLFLAGKLNNLAGLIVGDFSGVYPGNSNQHRSYLESIWKRILELCGKGDFPIWGNFPVGHCQHNMTLPLGAMALMQSGKARLVFPSARTRYMI